MEVCRHNVVAQSGQKLKDETWNRLALYDISCHEDRRSSLIASSFQRAVFQLRR